MSLYNYSEYIYDKSKKDKENIINFAVVDKPDTYDQTTIEIEKDVLLDLLDDKEEANMNRL